MTSHFESAIDIGLKIQRGEMTSVAVTEELLGRIATLEPRLRSYVSITAEAAILAARQADDEISRGEHRRQPRPVVQQRGGLTPASQ